MSEQQRPTGATENLAEIMAWHGMARYADPDVLAAYARPAAGPSADRPEGEDGPPVRE